MTKAVSQWHCFTTRMICWQLTDDDIEHSSLLAGMQSDTACIIHDLQCMIKFYTGQGWLLQLVGTRELHRVLTLMHSPAQVGNSQDLQHVLTTRDNTRPMANVPVSVPEIAPSAVVRATTYTAHSFCGVLNIPIPMPA